MRGYWSFRGLLALKTGPLAGGHQFVALIVGAVKKSDDTLIRPRLRFAQLDHFGFDVERIAVKDRFGEPYLIPTEIGNGCSESRIANRNANHQTQGERGIHQSLAILGMAHVLLIEMQLCGI